MVSYTVLSKLSLQQLKDIFEYIKFKRQIMTGVLFDRC